MTPWRHHLRRARFAATVLVAVVLIGAAVAMGLVQVLLPLATRHPDFIARQLSTRLQRPVNFAAVSSQWQPSGPLLVVRDLTLGPAQPGGASLTLPHAALKFDFGAWLRPSRRWITLRLSGLELRVEHGTAGWLVAGFGNSAGESHVALQSLPVDLDLRDLRVDVIDDARQRSWQVYAPHLRVVNVGNAIRFGGSVQRLGTQQAVTISGRVNAAMRNYDLYVSTHDFNLAEAARDVDLHGYTLRNGQGDFELWGRWRSGKLQSAALRYAVRDLAAFGPADRSVNAASLAGVVEATRAADGWNLAWRGPAKPKADIDQAGGVIAQVRGQPGAWRVTAAAHAVDATPWLALLAMAPQVPKGAAAWTLHAQPHVSIDTAALAWQEGGRFGVDAKFSGLRVAASGAIPGLALAQGTLRADNHAMSLELPEQPAVVALTHVFRRPFVFRQLGGTLVAWQADGQWNAATDALHFDTGTLTGHARARLTWLDHGQPPFLSASAAVTRAKVSDADLFWPYRDMPKHLVAWLDHALAGGEVTSGRVLVRGNLGDWPFVDHAGRFAATGTVKDATFNFADDWPSATGVDAAVEFVDNGMHIVASHALARDVTVTHAVATIPDFRNGVLGLDIKGGGSGGELLDFVRHSPVGAGAAAALDGLSVGGTGKFGVQLSIPLDAAEKFTLGGEVDLAKADVANPKWNLALKNLGGPLVLNDKGFNATGLTATFRGAPAKLAIAVGGNSVANPADSVEASMDTRVSAQTLVQGFPDLDGLVAHASGVAPFHVAVNVAAGQGGAPATPVLSVQSSLAGIALDFPTPLDKPASPAWPLDLRLPLPPAGATLTASLGDVLQVRGRLADSARKLPTALALNFGTTPPASVPAQGMTVSGRAGKLDLSGWIQQALAGGSGSAFPRLTRARVTTDAANVFGTGLGPLQFGFAAGAGVDSITLDGVAARGTIEVPTSDLMARGITAQLQHLYWPETPEPKHPGPPQPPAATSPVAPASVPPLHVTVTDLKLGKAQLGATVFESAPTAQGMHIAKFDSKGADFTIQSHGDWDGTKAASKSHMVIGIDSQDFGKTLAAFGFSGLLAGGRNAKVRIDGTWPGSPSGFSLAWMQGKLDIKVGEGQILAVKPGLGRLLGLLSLRELPNRLMLHFGDVFKSGFGFDHASAAFVVEGGSAYTQNMLIEAPAAQIAMLGRTGFRAQDYDLTVHVTPHIGGTLPVVGAVLGGPVGAAAGLVVQGLIGHGINKAAGAVYRVTGGWDKPKIETVAALPVPAISTVAPAAGAPLPAPAVAATVASPASAVSGH
jgi:uncharacterized protein (TIGR02099 family)